MTPLDSGNPWRVGAGAVKTCLDADVNRWSKCRRIAHTNRPELGVTRGNYVQSLTARSGSLQGKAALRPAAAHNRTLDIEAGVGSAFTSDVLVAKFESELPTERIG